MVVIFGHSNMNDDNKKDKKVCIIKISSFIFSCFFNLEPN